MKRRDFIGTAAGAAVLGAFKKNAQANGRQGAEGPSPESLGPPSSLNTKAGLAAQLEGTRAQQLAIFERPSWSDPPVELDFQGDFRELLPGIEVLAPELNFKISPRGLKVGASLIKQNLLRVVKKGKKAEIHYNRKNHFFRGLGLLLQEMNQRKDFEITEEPQFTTVGAMFDVSQGNAVIGLPAVKVFLNLMAVMGLNMLMLYSEDSYDIKGEPYFGYMRGRYSQDELREIDRYAAAFGIEAIPCMQTLAHLTDVLQWEAYRSIKEDEDTLLPGNDKTYGFIERMIAAASAPFRTKRIHIGMDEAWRLGQGNYLKLHGWRKKIDIMTEHLSRVLEITEKHGLRPMIWSDMYFRAASKTGDYYDETSAISPEDIARMPRNVQFVYWDYYHNEPAFYKEWIRRHREFGSDPVFAGGIWGWQGYGMSHGKTFVTTNAALGACKETGVKEVFATIWGDATTESNIFGHLLGLQLFAEHAYAREFDEAKLSKRFEYSTGCRYQDFWDLNGLNAIPGVDRNSPANPSRYLMWQDLLMGLFDKNIEGLPLEKHYASLSDRLEAAAGRNDRFNFVFEYYAKASSALALKSEVGLKTRAAYIAKDREALKRICAEILPDLADRVAKLRDYHRSLWLEIHQPPGWEIMDLRYGALLARIDTARLRLDDYLAGRLALVAELEEERLPWQGREGVADLICNSYDRIVSASRLAYSYKM
jgi:hexosaminidase